MKWLRVILGFPSQLWLSLISGLHGSVGFRLRHLYWRSRLGDLGKGAIIGRWVTFESPKDIFIGAYTWIDHHVIISAGTDDDERPTHFKENTSFTKKKGQVHIGTHCHIAPFVILNGLGGLQIGNRCGLAAGSKVYSLSHHYRLPGIDEVFVFSNRIAPVEQGLISGPVVIGDECGIGLDAIIFPGSTIGSGGWLAAQAQLTGSVPEGHLLKADGQLTVIGHPNQKP
jgi:galactoside O-acetyltransferase